MLFTAYAYSWYKDKNRQTAPELYDSNTSEPPSPPMYILLMTFVIELIFLYHAIPIAFRVARSRAELLVHMLFVILATPLYLFVHVASQVWKDSSIQMV